MDSGLVSSFTPPSPGLGISVVAGLAVALLAAILPTCLYLYVEPRARLRWAVAGDTPATRRAPRLVRVTAWLSFAVGQLALPWLAVPASCAALVYLQAKLGVVRPFGFVATVAVGVMSLVQCLLAVRLLPLGVRLLACDGRLRSTLRGRARSSAVASSFVVGGCATFGWVISAVPGFVHPWLRTALVWSAVRPAIAYAAVCLLHALLLWWCAAALPWSATLVEDRSRR